MSLQDDCNAHHQNLYDTYEAFLQAHRDAYADALANGADTQLLVAWSTKFDRAKATMQQLCTAATAGGNSVPNVTVQSSPGPKGNDPIN